MIDIIFSLLDRCIQLIKQRQETDRKLYEDFVAPAILDFEKVHQNYLETFQGYRNSLEDRSISLTIDHPVLKRIKQDSLFSSQLRSKLEALEEFQNDSVFGDLMKSIVLYTRGGEISKEVLLMGRHGLNVPRSYAIDGLTALFKDEDSESSKLEKALALIDRVVSEMQWGYSRVMDEHMKLKKRLLDRRLGR